MSKWRPTLSGNIYVIPDIHGAKDLLDSILKRILPLRKKDKLVFLGDYIDRHIDSHKVLDTLINVQKKYPDRVVFLCGNHELIMLEALGYEKSDYQQDMISMWYANGGIQTLMGYMERNKLDKKDIFNIYKNISRVKSLVPKEHIDFLQNLKPHHTIDNFVFVHGGYNPLEPISNFDKQILTWDRSLCKFVKQAIESNFPIPWEQVIVTGHNAQKNPVIHPNFLMLDIGSPRRLLVMELYSRTAWLSQPGKRLSKFEIKNTEIKNDSK